MPTAVIIDDAVGLERREEIDRQFKAEHSGEAKSHVRIAGKIEIELRHIGQRTDPRLHRMNFSTDMRRAENDIDRGRKIVGDDHFLEHADRDERQAHCKVDRVQAEKPLRLDLRIELAEIGDRSDDELREEADEGAIPAKSRTDRFHRSQLAEELGDVLFARIGICKEGGALECVEGNPGGNGDPGNIHHDPGARTEQQAGDLVFEIAQGDDVVGLPGEVDALPALLAFVEKCDRERDGEIHHQCGDQQYRREQAVRYIKRDRGRKQDSKPGIPAQEMRDRIECDQCNREEHEKEERVCKYHISPPRLIAADACLHRSACALQFRCR